MLPSRHGLRDLRLQTERAAEIQVIGIQVVGAVQVDIRSLHPEREIAERDGRVVHLEFAGHARDYFVDLLVFRLPLAAPAESVNLILNGGAEKLASGDLKAPIQQKLLFNFSG